MQSLLKDKRLVPPLLVVLILVLGISYKYLEWNLLKKLVELDRKTTDQEFVITEESYKRQNEMYPLMSKLGDTEKMPSEKIQTLLSDIRNLITLDTSETENYYQILKNNQKEYNKLRKFLVIPLGKRAKFANNFLSSVNRYYEDEIVATQENILGDHLFSNIFLVWKDFLTQADFSKKIGSRPDLNASKYFSLIASLEKYSRKDFKFDEENSIKEKFPYSYSYLDKSRKYLGSYYEIIKDYAAGDKESAQYKGSLLSYNSVDLNVDYDQLFDEGKENRIERAKRIADSTIKKIELIKKFKNDNLAKYPFLPEIRGWKDDLTLCQLYAYKASMYNSITSDYPPASNSSEMIASLAKISPKSDSIDNSFDISLLKVTNDEKRISFECFDKEDNKTYTFETTK